MVASRFNTLFIYRNSKALEFLMPPTPLMRAPRTRRVISTDLKTRRLNANVTANICCGFHRELAVDNRCCGPRALPLFAGFFARPFPAGRWLGHRVATVRGNCVSFTIGEVSAAGSDGRAARRSSRRASTSLSSHAFLLRGPAIFIGCGTIPSLTQRRIVSRWGFPRRAWSMAVDRSLTMMCGPRDVGATSRQTRLR
jgi:hypothetical protein